MDTVSWIASKLVYRRFCHFGTWIYQAFFLDDFPGDAGGQNLRYLEFFCLFCWVFEKNLLSFQNMLSFLREYWVFPTKTLSLYEKSFQFIQYSPEFYIITFFSYKYKFSTIYFCSSTLSGSLKNLRYLEFCWKCGGKPPIPWVLGGNLPWVFVKPWVFYPWVLAWSSKKKSCLRACFEKKVL